MSKNRKMAEKPLVKGPNGRNCCRWCGKETAPPRRTFCSNECVDEYLIRRQPQYARRRVWERDNGTCTMCGLKVWKLQSRYHYARPENLRRRTYLKKEHLYPNRRKRFDRWIQLRRQAREAIVKEYPWVSGVSMWQADHIVPVCEGGGECGLDNLRLLCTPCHKEETKKLAKRRATSTVAE